MTELLAPAGNAECAIAAINNGADAIYLGFKAFSARQSADNFDMEALREIIKTARFCGVKTFVAMNTIVKDGEVEEFLRALLFVWNAGADAIILQDALLGKAVHEKYPQIVLHLSTQAGVCNENGAIFAKKCGFSRVILARETPLDEIEKITKILETEVFVQGALCTAFSGQCYFSSFVGGNSGNRGRCKQPCRKVYAYDRKGNQEKNYALSLSDLCVGEDIKKLIDVGVTSFKIEGRMRRAEYVAAAVRYYRGLLNNDGDSAQNLSDLKRAYNRGNYTKGLAFGQDKRLLSTAVQGHMGEKVGVVKVINGNFFVESRFTPRTGDAFKILRDGKEMCGAIFQKLQGKGFTISAKTRLKNGDGVFITTDTAVNERVLSAVKKRTLCLQLVFVENQPPVVEIDGVRIIGDKPLQRAKNSPLSEEDLVSCFSKTDGLPAQIVFEKIQIKGNIFIAKSELNAFRRSVYAQITGIEREACEYAPLSFQTPQGRNTKTATIASDFTQVQTDIAIYKPTDYREKLPQSFLGGDFEKYLYYPPFCTHEDERAITAWLSQTQIDGIYAENYGAIEFAAKHNLALFLGTGLNLANGVALRNISAKYYAISKELNDNESAALAGVNAFTLRKGGIKLMDLCYCPFGKTCNACDKKVVYLLTDESGRQFPVRRYLDGKGNCRFEVYNCNKLVNEGTYASGVLIDATVEEKCFTERTLGHAKRGVL